MTFVTVLKLDITVHDVTFVTLWLYLKIAMHDVTFVTVVDGLQDLPERLPRVHFRHTPILCDMI